LSFCCKNNVNDGVLCSQKCSTEEQTAIQLQKEQRCCGLQVAQRLVKMYRSWLTLTTIKKELALQININEIFYKKSKGKRLDELCVWGKERNSKINFFFD
jgi:hypothetical protein